MRARAMRARAGRGRTRAPPRRRRRRRAQAHGRRRPSSRGPVFAAGGGEAAGLEAAQRLDRAHEGASAHRQHGGQQRAAHCMCCVCAGPTEEGQHQAILLVLTHLHPSPMASAGARSRPARRGRASSGNAGRTRGLDTSRASDRPRGRARDPRPTSPVPSHSRTGDKTEQRVRRHCCRRRPRICEATEVRAAL